MDYCGIKLRERFERSDNRTDIDNSVTLLELAKHTIPYDHPNITDILEHLFLSLMARFDRFGNLPDLQRCISVGQQAVDVTSSTRSDFSEVVANLAAALSERYRRLHSTDDLDQSIVLWEKMLDSTLDSDANKPIYLNNLALSLSERYGCSLRPDDIERAIRILEEAVNLSPASDSGKLQRISNLGTALAARYDHVGDVEDLTQAIYFSEKAVQLAHSNDPLKPRFLSQLGGSLKRRFVRHGDMADFDHSVVNLKQAVELTPDGHPAKNMYLTNLGCVLLDRYARLGNLGDLKEAVSSQRRAVACTPDNHPQKPTCLGNLLLALKDYRHHSGDPVAALQEIVLVGEQALTLLPVDDLDRPRVLTLFASGLSDRYSHSHDTTDLEEAINLQRQAVELTSDIHRLKPGYLRNLGDYLRRRFGEFKNLADIEAAILFHKRAIELIPDGHRGKPLYLQNLARSLMARYKVSEDFSDSAQAISLYHRAAIDSTGDPSVRFEAAQRWAAMSAETSAQVSNSSARSNISVLSFAHGVDLTDCLSAYATAMDLIPRLVWLGRTITERHNDAEVIGDTVKQAAVAAIISGKHALALEWLEQGRSIIWGQLLALRSPLDELRRVDEVLANELTRVSRELEQASTREDHSQLAGEGQVPVLSLEEAGQRHRKMAREWERLLERVRMVPGFEDFSRPKKFSTLRQAARLGPVVLLNVCDSPTIRGDGCDALVMLDGLDDVMRIPLPDFSLAKAKKLQARMRQLLHTSHVRERASALAFISHKGETMPVFSMILASFGRILSSLCSTLSDSQ